MDGRWVVSTLRNYKQSPQTEIRRVTVYRGRRNKANVLKRYDIFIFKFKFGRRGDIYNKKMRYRYRKWDFRGEYTLSPFVVSDVHQIDLQCSTN